MDSPTPRGPYAKTPARKEEIVAAAAEVFSGAGFRSGSLRDIADRVGLSQAGLLHHYSTKNLLLEAVLQWRDDHTLSLWGGDFPKGKHVLEALLGLVASNTSTPGLVELHVVLSAEATAIDHPVHDYFVNRYLVVIDAVRLAFEEIERDGDLRPGVDPASAARGLVALLDGLQLQWLLDRDSVDMVEHVRQYLRLHVTTDI